MDKVVHFEISTDDRDASRTFYKSVFDWQLNDMPMQMNGGTGTYTSITTVPTDQQTMIPKEPGAINGGLRDRDDKVKGPVITIEVESIEDSLKKIESAGGRTVLGKQTIDNMGHYAYFTDPDGNVMGLWENIPR